MTAVSQGLKAGLAAGVIYAAIIGLMSLTTLLGCSSAQISFIAAHSPTNVSASSIFYSTDIVYYPMVYGVLTLVFGLIFGLIFTFGYSRLPGSNSKIKGSILGVAVFLAVAFIGPGFFDEYACVGSAFPDLIFGLSVPAALLFGYLLGSFYDSFGRLEREETEQRATQEHWSDAFRRKPPKEQSEDETTS